MICYIVFVVGLVALALGYYLSFQAKKESSHAISLYEDMKKGVKVVFTCTKCGSVYSGNVGDSVRCCQGIVRVGQDSSGVYAKWEELQ